MAIHSFKLKMGSLDVTCLLLYVTATLLCQSGEAYYHLATPDKVCEVSSIEGETVDLVCQYFDKQKDAAPCQLKSLQWKKLEGGNFMNMTDSPKYGVWEAIPGWGMEEGEHVSLLRVRHVNPLDIARYQCEISCVDNMGRQHISHHQLDICLQQGGGKFGLCPGRTEHDNCAKTFWNGRCDARCDKDTRMFDGFDCEQKMESCNPAYDDYCASRFANGICDERCDKPECSWDGGDCITSPLQFADDTIVLMFTPALKKNLNIKLLGRELSKLLRTIVRVFPDDWLEDQVYQSNIIYSKQEGYSSTTKTHPPNIDSTQEIKELYPTVKVYLKLDNTKCTTRCFSKAEQATRFLSSALKDGWDPGISILQLAVLKKSLTVCPLENNTLLHIDLKNLVSKDAAYSYQNSNQHYQLEVWMLVAIVAGSVCFVVLLAAIGFVIHRLRSLSALPPHTYAETERIKVDRDAPAGTDV